MPQVFHETLYVMDICRIETGLRMLETNCINAAGFYAAEVDRLAEAIDNIDDPDL